MKIPRVYPLALVALLGLCLCAGSAVAASDDWKAVDPGELALKAPTVDKTADAEALFWEVRIDDDSEGDLIFNHYLRIKVFTDRGREAQSKIEIPYGNFGREIKIKDIAARTIKADGSIVELKKDDVFDRTVVKVSGLKVKVKSFAMPAVEPGCIIEYRWREVRVNSLANYVRLQFQRDIPVQRVDYYIKPMAFENYGMASMTFHGQPTRFVKDKNGFFKTTMTSMPAILEEARMPPEDQIKTWMLVYYTQGTPNDPKKFWSDKGREIYSATKSLMKPNDDVKQTAASLTADAKTADEKLQKLFGFCRTKIVNVSNDATTVSVEDRKKVKDNKSPADTLKRGMGDAADVDLLFASLATAAGFDARIVFAPDRGDIFFAQEIRNFPDTYFLEPSNIAVNVEGTWKFFNPGYNYIPFGMLRWQEEGEEALVTDPKEPVWVHTPLSPPDKSKVTRRAKFKLAEDGTLEGDVTIQYTGHMGIERKEDNDAQSDTEREAALKEEIKNQMSAAEISGIKIENVTDQVKPLFYSYHVKFPAYAQKTGKRLFLQPAFFQHGLGPMFATSDRKYPIYFHYPWSEDDVVEIEIPTGFTTDNADAPAPFGSAPISEYKPQLQMTTDGKILIYTRKFFFGGNESLLFPTTSYTQLKAYFEALNKEDNHTVALKQTAAN
ncbi:MAG TPA: DUF3857 and transglutaminase domain-containing protein [Pyrinomonadaceae bacterium]